MIELLHDHSLIYDWLNLLFAGKLVLSHDLHGIETACILLPHENHPAECSSSDHLDLLKVMATDLMGRLSILSEC